MTQICLEPLPPLFLLPDAFRPNVAPIDGNVNLEGASFDHSVKLDTLDFNRVKRLPMLKPIEEIRQLKVSREIAAEDQMYNSDADEHYFYVGRSDLLTMINAINIRSSYHGGDAPIREILDFGCGHGRVTRWIRAAFPAAELHVTDYDPKGAAFCATRFACTDTQGDIADNKYDLVWLGSVFTHLPQHIAEPLIRRLCSALAHNGILVFTSQGRYSVSRMMDFDWLNDHRHWMHYSIDRLHFEQVVAAYLETGYGYVDYPGQSDYGVCIARPSWYSERVLSSNEFIQILLQEKGADNHQDVSAFMRADLLDDKKGPLW